MLPPQCGDDWRKHRALTQIQNDDGRLGGSGLGERRQLLEPQRRRAQARRFHELVEATILRSDDADG